MKLYGLNNVMFYEIEQAILHSDEFSNAQFPVCLSKLNCDEKCIVYNTEQTTLNGFPFQSFQHPLIQEVWDYSEANVENFKRHGVENVRLVKPKIWDSYRQKILSYNEDNTYIYDVAFVGWIQERRQKILDLLRAENIKVNILNQHFLEDRDKEIAKSKILLNVHFQEHYKIFEMIRCFPWLDTNKIVVSENSLDNDDRAINVPYENIVETIKSILNK